MVSPAKIIHRRSSYPGLSGIDSRQVGYGCLGLRSGVTDSLRPTPLQASGLLGLSGVVVTRGLLCLQSYTGGRLRAW
jgi:hypothetical protein